MEEFDYLSVLISIILGLALTQLLTGAGRLIRFRDRVKFYAPTPIWMGFLFLMIVQSWWAMFVLRFNDEWTFVEFAVVLAQPTLIYLMVELIIPDTDGPGPIDLKANYFRQAPVFFSVAIVLIAVSLARPVIMVGALAEPLDVGTQLVWIALAGTAIFWRNQTYHQALAPTMAILAIVYVSVLFLALR